MKIRVYGFAPALENAPRVVTPEMPFEAMHTNKGNPVDRSQLIRVAAAKIPSPIKEGDPDWWAGIIVRARASKTFNQLEDENGEITLTARQLANGRIAEVAYFVANPETGRGLLACYHEGPQHSLLSLVARRCTAKAVKALRESALSKLKKAAPDYDKQRDRVKADHHGWFEFSKLLSNVKLRPFLKSLKTLNRVYVTYSTVEVQKHRFKQLTTTADERTEVYSLPIGYEPTDDLIAELEEAAHADEIDEVTVEGKNRDKQKRAHSSDEKKNKWLFEEGEYDQLMVDLKLKLKNWDSSIKAAAVVNWLRELIPTRKDIQTALCGGKK